MTNETQTQAIETTTEEKVTAMRKWKPKKVTSPELNDGARAAASVYAERLSFDKDSKKIEIDSNAYWEAMELNGVPKAQAKAYEEALANTIRGAHAAITDEAHYQFGEDADLDEIEVKTKFGGNTTYTDSYKRKNTRSVTTGAPKSGAPREDRDYYADNRPSITTKVSNIKADREAFHEQAAKFLAGK